MSFELLIFQTYASKTFLLKLIINITYKYVFMNQVINYSLGTY